MSLFRQHPTQPSEISVPQIDTAKRYDIYCHEAGYRIVVYRGARFAGFRRLFPPAQKFDVLADFYELELANGKAIFVMRHSVMKFCEPGIDPGAEVVSSK
jgi:hypothetical protein